MRDFAANERTFLSHLRLAMYLAIVAVALLAQFHLKDASDPGSGDGLGRDKDSTDSLEKRTSLPLGIVFWVLSLGAVTSSVGMYVRSIEGYGRRKAIVQSGWGLQAVSGLKTFFDVYHGLVS